MECRQAMAALALALMTLAVAGARAQDHEALLDPYFRIHASLSADRLDGVAADASAIARQAGTMGEAGQPMKAAASELSAAKDLDGARSAFGRLSDALIAWADDTEAGLGPGVVMYCSMAKKSWVQKDDAVKNPYYGSAMLTCGEKKKRSS